MRIYLGARRVTTSIRISLRNYATGFSTVALVLGITAASLFIPRPARSQGSPVPAELLYVADSNGATQEEHTQVLVVDPHSKKIVKTYPAHFHPDIALSPDGTRLYLASYFDSHDKDGEYQGEVGKLDVIDTATGNVIASVNQSEWVAMGPAYGSSMALSHDGRWLYMYVNTAALNDHAPAEGVAVFDTTQNKFLPVVVSTPRCGASLLVPWTNNAGLSVICSIASDVRSVQFNDQGVPATRSPAALPIPHRHEGPTRFYQPNSASAYMSGDQELTVLLGDGRFCKLNVETGATVQEGAIQFSQPLLPSLKNVGIGAYNARGRYIGSRLIQGAQGLIYVVLSRNDRAFHATDAIAVLDARTLRETALFQPGYLFWGAVLSRDGKRFYVLSVNVRSSGKSSHGNIHVLNSSDGSEIEEIHGIGVTPTILIPAP